MLSYDTNKMGPLISKVPPDMPKELLPGSYINHTSSDMRRKDVIATKVPEAAGMAAVEQPATDQFIKNTSDAILKGIPEVLHDPYRVNLSESDLEIRPKPGEWVGNQKTMTRIEYIQYVREQCEKELLSYIPKRPVEINTQKIELEEDVREEVQGLPEAPLVKETTMETKLDLPLVMKEKLEEGLTMEQMKESKKSNFIRRLWIRSIVAMCLFIGLVSFDLLNIHIGSTRISDVKNVVANNTTIQKIERIVSDFAENTVLPVFGVDKKEDQ